MADPRIRPQSGEDSDEQKKRQRVLLQLDMVYLSARD